MSRKLLFGLLGATLMAALVGTPAMAHHAGSKGTPAPHVPAPEAPEAGILEALCVVDGGVTTNNASLDGGVSPTQPNHNHYEFIDAALECTDVNPNTTSSGGTWEVVAGGASDSCAPATGAAAHGETGAEGCGNGAIGDFTLGALTATNLVTGDVIDGEVDFVRSTTSVLAYGELSGALGDGCFVAELEFQPHGVDPTNPTAKITSADLDGIAEVMLEASPGVCGP